MANSKRAFMQLNPSSISIISILKDASATAVYGVRGANGVFIVETKKGQEGKTRISANVSSGYQVPTNILEFANAYQWTSSYNEALQNDGQTAGFIPQSDVMHFKEHDQPLIFPDHDWMKEVIDNKALQTRTNIDISGGTKDVKYFTNFSYFKQDGIISQFGPNMENFGYNRFNMRTNLDINITPSTHVSFTSSGRIGIQKKPTSGQAESEQWKRLHEVSPMASVGLVDGKWINVNSQYYPYLHDRTSTIVDEFYRGSYNRTTENRLNINIDFQQKLNVLSPILEGLKKRKKLCFRSGFN